MSSLPLHLQLRNARRAHGLTQVELARQADCTQSAVSMMESGQTSAMARSTLETIAKILEVDLPPESPAPSGVPSPAPASPAVAETVRICPNADCPGNLPYRVGGEVLFMPHRHQHSGKRCIYCGEILVDSCPECGTPLHAGAACCPECGSPLVPSAIDPAVATDAWIENRRRQSAQLLSW